MIKTTMIITELRNEINDNIDEQKFHADYFTKEDEKEIVTQVCKQAIAEIKQHSALFGYIIK